MSNIISPFDLLIYALAVFRLAYAIAHETGPAFAFLRLRKAVKKNKDSSMAEGISCSYCLSLQASLLLTLFIFTKHLLAVWAGRCVLFLIIALAISGASLLVHQVFVFLRKD